MAKSSKQKRPLTENETEAYRLRYTEGLNFRAIANELGVDLHCAHDAVKRAEKKLSHKGQHVAKCATTGERLLRNEAVIEAALKNRSPAAVLELLEDLVVRIVCMMDNEVLAKESGRGLAQMLSHLTNVLQLRKGEPTTITRYEDIRKIDELAVAIKDEIERRQQLVAVTPEPIGEAARPA